MCMQEIMVYKSSILDSERKKTQKFKQAAIKVTLFDQLEGLDKETLSIVNMKIKEIQQECESRLVELLKVNEEMSSQLSFHNQNDQKQIKFFQLSQQEYTKGLTQVVKDVNEFFESVIEIFGEPVIKAAVNRKFG